MFSDSRQDAARVNAGLELAHYMDTVRQLVVGAAAERDLMPMVVAHFRGEDQSIEAAAAAANVQGGARVAAMRLAMGTPEAGDDFAARGTSLLRPRSASRRSRRASNQNCSGSESTPAASRSMRRPARRARGGPNLGVGAERSRAADHEVTPTLRSLRQEITSRLVDQVRQVAFASQGRDLESIGVARATVPALPGDLAGLAPEHFAEVRDSCVRILGQLRRFTDGDMRSGENIPPAMLRYVRLAVSRVAPEADPDQVVLRVCEALGLSVVNGYRLDARSVSLTPDVRERWICSQCRQLHGHASARTCTGCGAVLDQLAPGDVDQTTTRCSPLSPRCGSTARS